MSNWVKETMQDIASEINKSQRELLFPYIDTAKRKLSLRFR